MHYCTVPMDIIEDVNGDPHYVFCGKEATHAVAGSLWCVCQEHANTMEAEGRWELIPIEEVKKDDQGYTSRCENIGGLAQSQRKDCSCGEAGSCKC